MKKERKEEHKEKEERRRQERMKKKKKKKKDVKRRERRRMDTVNGSLTLIDGQDWACSAPRSPCKGRAGVPSGWVWVTPSVLGGLWAGLVLGHSSSSSEDCGGVTRGAGSGSWS